MLIADIGSGRVPFPNSGVNGLLLYGAYGTGKSTLANLLPKAIEALHSNDAPWVQFDIKQGDNGAATLSRIVGMAGHVPLSGSKHYFVLDEVDLLKGATMASLKSAMNLPDTVFVMTTNLMSIWVSRTGVI